jgi:3'-5' exoribonuclease
VASERPLTDPRADGGSERRPFRGRVPWVLIADLAPGDEVAACYVVQAKRRTLTSAGQPSLLLVLADRTGTIEGVMLDDVDRWDELGVPGTVVGARGRVAQDQDRLRLDVAELERVEAAPQDLERLVPASRRDAQLMERELDAQIASVRDRPLRTLLRRCLGRDTRLGAAFRAHPAAARNHHAFLYGLLEHTLSVAGLCDRLVEHYRGQGVHLDRDLLIAGALLHDLGKVIEIEPPPAGAYTTPGRLLGHILLGIQIVDREARDVPGFDEERLLLVQHLIASHQGRPEWESPRVPQVIEALVLHYADDLDAKLNQAAAVLDGVDPGNWSGFDRSLARALYLPASAREVGPGGKDSSGDAVIDLFRG